MPVSLDEFEDIRNTLYELQDQVAVLREHDPQLKFLASGISAAVCHSDDYRITLLDQQDDEEEAWETTSNSKEGTDS